MYHSNYGMTKDEFFDRIKNVSLAWFGLNIEERKNICKRVGWPLQKSATISLRCESVTIPQLFIIGRASGLFPADMGCPIL